MKKWILLVPGILMVIAGIIMKIRKTASIAVIGGADGPTSVFVAGKLGDGFASGLAGAGVVLLLIGLWLFRKGK